jgi:hypothetical protein
MLLGLQQLQTIRPGIVPKISLQCIKTCRMATAARHPRRAMNFPRYSNRDHMRVVMASSEQEGKLFGTNFNFPSR